MKEIGFSWVLIGTSFINLGEDGPYVVADEFEFIDKAGVCNTYTVRRGN
jgi:hypothetical protein